MIKKICLAGLAVLLLVSGIWVYRLNGDRNDLLSLLSSADRVLDTQKTAIDKLLGERAELQTVITEKEIKIMDLEGRLKETVNQLPAVYGDGYQKGRESTLLKKPTYAEVKDLLAKDGSTIWPLFPGQCTILAMESRDYWMKKGLKVGVVSLYFYALQGHLAIVFDTSDQGEVYVDLLPAEEGNGFIFKEIKVELGKSFSQLNGLANPGFDDRVFDTYSIW